MTKFVVPIISALMITFAIPACAWPVTYSAEPIEAWLIDDETKEPIEGAIIVAHWVLEGGIHVDRVGELVILEAVSDKSGRSHFPAWGPIRHWKSSRLTNYDPEILIFKNGYKYQRLFNEATKEAITGKPFPVRKSRWSGKTISLTKFEGSPKEYAGHLSFFHTSVRSLLYGGHCLWKKIPRLIVAMDEMEAYFRNRGVYSPLYSIDDLPNDKCGSVFE